MLPATPLPARRSSHPALLAVLLIACLAAAEPDRPPLRIEDLYKMDAVVDPVTLADGRTAVYCRQWAVLETRKVRQAIYRVDDSGPGRPLEDGAPDGFKPIVSPDEKWIVFHSARPFPDGTPAVRPLPAHSDPAADLWLVPVTGGKAIPL